MRILQLLDSLEAGGAQRVALGLSQWLIDDGHEVVIVARDGALREQVPLGAQLIIAKPSKFRYALTAFRQAVISKPAIVHSHQRPEALMGWLMSKVSRLSSVEHAHTVLSNKSRRLFSFRSDRIFAVSPSVVEMLTESFRVSPGKIVLVNNAPGISASVQPTPQRDSTRLRVVGIGRMAEQKDPLRFVAVVSELAKDIDVEAIWVGDGPLRSDAEAYALAEGAPVEFVGFQRDVVPFIDDSSIVLMTSRWEGMPLVALETLARGRVLVAPRLDGLRDLVELDEYGLGYEVNATPEHIASLIRLHAGGRSWAEWMRKGPQHIQHHFSVDAAFGPVLQVYEYLRGVRGD